MKNLPENLTAYIDLAREESGVKTDLALAQKLGITRASMSQIRSGTFLPGEELMAKIAKLARQDEALALLQLNSWRSKDAHTRQLYEKLVAAMRKIAAVIGLTFLITATGGAYPNFAHARTVPAQADMQSGTNVYYGK